ncbi:MAG: AIM24 family protein [Solirubrobacterales bacterium]
MQIQDQFARDTESPDSFSLQNNKMLKIELSAVTIQAKRGSMVAYQGEVKFEHAGGGGLGRMVKKAMTGEGASLMKIEGSGEVFLADQANEIHLVKLDDDELTCNGGNVLAFDSGIDWDITRLKGGMAGALAGGLFNIKLRGTGWVALTTDGPPLLLDVGEAATFADAQAAVCWSSGVTTQLKTDVNLKTLTGRASGETVQLAFSGRGWLLVQPSEGRYFPAAQGA